MPWIGLLLATWLVVFIAAGMALRWAVAGAEPLAPAAWVVVTLAAVLLASAATMGLAAARWRRDARSGRATAEASATRRELRMGNGYVMLAAGCGLAAVLLMLVYRLMYIR